MIVRDYDSKNVLKDLIRALERASFGTCAFIEIRLELREINELLTELYKIPDTNEAEPQTETRTETQNSNLTFEKRTMFDCYNCKRYKSDDACVECRYEPIADTPQCERYVITNDEGEKAYGCMGCQTDCPRK